MTTDPRHVPDSAAPGTSAVDSLWDRMRSEERSEKLAHVVEDTVRDARLADALAAPDADRGK